MQLEPKRNQISHSITRKIHGPHSNFNLSIKAHESSSAQQKTAILKLTHAEFILQNFCKCHFLLTSSYDAKAIFLKGL